MKPVALIATFTDAVLPVILDEIAAGGDPPVADWFVGTYGVNAATARRVEATPGCGYAPIFSVQPPNSRRARLGRHVPPPVAAVLDPARAGAIPGSSAGAVVPPSDRRAWGLELGRRFRDDLRAARASGVPVSAWQFDEILGECGRPGAGNPHREFVGGVLRGLAEGRPELAESHEPEFVRAARTAITRPPGSRWSASCSSSGRTSTARRCSSSARSIRSSAATPARSADASPTGTGCCSTARGRSADRSASGTWSG